MNMTIYALQGIIPQQKIVQSSLVISEFFNT